MKKTIVIAIGGNAITSESELGTIEEQYKNVEKFAKNIINLIKKDYNIIITHGNGPQVGNLLLQNEAAKKSIPEMPLDVCVSQTQGQIGYIISQTINNLLKEHSIDKQIVTILTGVEVDNLDPAFENPTKPIGPFFSKEESKNIETTKGYTMIEDSGRGYRRVVPSPMPVNILEKDIIKDISTNNIVVACGGRTEYLFI